MGARRRRRVTVLPRSVTSTGAISASNRPSRWARSALRWLSSAKASDSARVMPYWRARTSAVSPMISPDSGHGEAVAIHRVDELEVAHLVAPPRVGGVHQIRHAAHRLDAAGHDHRRLAEQQTLRARGNRLQARRTGFVDCLGRRGVRHPGAMSHLAGSVRPGAGLAAVADQHLVHGVSGHAGTRESRPHGDGAKLRGVRVLQRAAVAANRRPRRSENHDLAGIHRFAMISNACSNSGACTRLPALPSRCHWSHRSTLIRRSSGENSSSKPINSTYVPTQIQEYRSKSSAIRDFVPDR